ncbi:hypothetical protein BS47DRAFT_1299838 [Hydnum rufescens UP504]|uniref:Transcription factor CBF/NF-Y/archaeal histone domain-containing protein n=1 Tax=Hydnum rufescens UP504 TaxID=1448309 RepID=A0A9P6ARU7_9AGAM|nr:hypothetical protein BS47DRAFT_1299838 [Hydnum rufescens UP504]
MGEHGAFVNSGDSLEAFLPAFWMRQLTVAEDEAPDFRHPSLPLARIKKVMKSDPDVKMIAADAPILFAKACEIFISEITARAWIVAESNKRRTLSRTDIARAISKSDQFDFLIDIIPREEKVLLSPTTHSKKSPPKTVKGQEGSGVSCTLEAIACMDDHATRPPGPNGK